LNSITAPYAVMAVLVTAVLGLFGWSARNELEKVRMDHHEIQAKFEALSITVQDISRAQASIRSRQEVLFGRIGKIEADEVAEEARCEQRFEGIRTEIRRNREDLEMRASDRYTGSQAQSDWAHANQLNGMQHDFLWTAIGGLQDDLRDIHDYLFKK